MEMCASLWSQLVRWVKMDLDQVSGITYFSFESLWNSCCMQAVYENIDSRVEGLSLLESYVQIR